MTWLITLTIWTILGPLMGLATFVLTCQSKHQNEWFWVGIGISGPICWLQLVDHLLSKKVKDGHV